MGIFILGVIALAAMPGGSAVNSITGSIYAAPAVTASFLARSYAPGQKAELAVRSGGAFMLQIFHAGPGAHRSRRADAMAGVPVTRSRRAKGPGDIRVAVGDWPSGLYFARMQQGHTVGFAPFVVRPSVLGRAHVLVVLPTNTWQAYNFRDDNDDGIGDTWYASSSIHSVDLTRPFLDRGVPPHYRAYDSGFITWLAHSGHPADVISDDDLERIGSGARLAHLYRLIVFPGHEEYVTSHTYDIVERFRNLGGNLMFLSANNFFYRVEKTGNVLHGRTRWRDQGRPEEKLIGAQYVDWFNWDGRAHPNQAYTVVGARLAPWLFRAAGLRNGAGFGKFGIEIDARGQDSPPGTRVLAQIPDAFGPGKSAQMTYYETSNGAKVFDAGVINFGGSALQPPVSRLLDALWARLSRP